MNKAPMTAKPRSDGCRPLLKPSLSLIAVHAAFTGVKIVNDVKIVNKSRPREREHEHLEDDTGVFLVFLVVSTKIHNRGLVGRVILQSEPKHIPAPTYYQAAAGCDLPLEEWEEGRHI